MEYLPSYTDSLYLAHHGIKGQHWGVRRFQNDDGTRTDAGKKRYYGTSNYNRMRRRDYALGTAARTRQKQQMFENKIKKSGDSNALVRNTINDWRRGRVAQLKTKADHREAKEQYRANKSKENLQALRSARAARVVKNGLNPVSTTSRGVYNRYRDNGHGVAASLLRSVGTEVGAHAIRNAASTAAGAAEVATMLSGAGALIR